MSTQKTNTPNTIFGIEIGVKVDNRLTKWVGMAFAIAAVVILVVWLVLAPRINDIQKVNKKIKQQEALLDNLNKKLDLIDEFSVDFSGQDDLMNKVFFSSNDSAAFLMLLRNLVDKAGMRIVNYKIGSSTLKTIDAKKTAAKDEISVEITINGPSGQVDTLLRLLDESLPIKTVSDFKITEGSLNGVGLVGLKMKVTTYSNPASVSAVATGLIKPFSDEHLDLAKRMIDFYQTPLIETRVPEPVTPSNRLLGF